MEFTKWSVRELSAEPPVVYCGACRYVHIEGRHLSLAEVQKRHLLQVYEATGRNKTRTAKLLKIDLRTVRRLLHRYS